MSESVKFLWTVASVILGFQIAAFIFRMQRETGPDIVEWERHLPVCEYLNLSSIVIFIGGVFILPLVRQGQDATARGMFAAAMTLFALYPFAVAAHYHILLREKAGGYFNEIGSRSEWLVFAIAIVAAVIVGCLTACRGSSSDHGAGLARSLAARPYWP
jgi:hypothetical protein